MELFKNSFSQLFAWVGLSCLAKQCYILYSDVKSFTFIIVPCFLCLHFCDCKEKKRRINLLALIEATLENESPCTLTSPTTLTMFKLYSLINESWRCCLSDNLCLSLLNTTTMGLWSVKIVTFCASIRSRHRFTDAKISKILLQKYSFFYSL